MVSGKGKICMKPFNGSEMVFKAIFPGMLYKLNWEGKKEASKWREMVFRESIVWKMNI